WPTGRSSSRFKNKKSVWRLASRECASCSPFSYRGNSMTHPTVHARTYPNKVAYQMAATGKAITYRELDELSNQGAQLFRALGLKAGDHIALLMENRLAFMEVCWAAQRSGLYYTASSRYLTLGEIAYIVRDCGATPGVTTLK